MSLAHADPALLAGAAGITAALDAVTGSNARPPRISTPAPYSAAEIADAMRWWAWFTADDNFGPPTSGDMTYSLLLGRACDAKDAWKMPAGLARDRAACNVRAAYPQMKWDEARAYVDEHPELVPDPDVAYPHLREMCEHWRTRTLEERYAEDGLELDFVDDDGFNHVRLTPGGSPRHKALREAWAGSSLARPVDEL
jgi:hypothetical protein